MTEAMIKAYNAKYNGQPLSIKQWGQLLTFCMKTQPFLPFSENAFLEILQKAIDFACIYRFNPHVENRFRKELDELILRFYPNGYKGGGSLTNNQVNSIAKIKNPRYQMSVGFPRPYNPIEKVAFVKTQRACYRWLTSQNDPNCSDELIDALIKIGLMLPR